MRPLPRIMFLAFILSLGVGCSSAQKNASLPVIPDPIVPIPNETWETIDDGVEKLTAERGVSIPKSSAIILYRFAPEKFSFRFENSAEPKTVGEWAQAFPTASLIMNGVYFHEDFLPSGFFVSKGQRVGTRAFDTSRSGMIVLAPSVSIFEDTGNQPTFSKITEEAAQSYPFLIKGGAPAISTDSKLVARRSFLGIDTEKNIYLGVVPGDNISLYELMGKLDGMLIDWEQVINLDGGPSSGVSVQTKDKRELHDSFVAVPNVIIVERKK